MTRLRLPVAIADRYIAREMLGPFLLGVGGFVVILIGDVLYTLVEFIATGRITLDVLGRVLAYKIPAIMVITFPVSTLLATLLGMGRLSRDRELQAMRLAGMSLGRIFAPALGFGLIVAALTFATNEYFAPWANHQANALIRGAAFGDAFPQVREHVFFRGPAGRVFYVGRVDETHRRVANVMIYEPGAPVPRLITAADAVWEGGVWTMHRGVVREFDEEGFTRYEARFTEMQLAVGTDGGTFFAGEKTPEEMTARELSAHLALFGRGGADARLAVELHRKFAVPAAGLVFVMLAAPLALLATGGRALGMGISVALLFLYYSVMSTTRAMGATGALPPAAAAWLPNLLFAAAGLMIWAREDGWFGRRPTISQRVVEAGAAS